MLTRNIQKTGNMHYVYLPTSWVKKHNISSDSKVSIDFASDGSLKIFPEIAEKKKVNLDIAINEDDINIINKLIVACYVNPLTSFKINLQKPLEAKQLLEQKRILSGLEMVEIEDTTIKGESTISVSNPQFLLITMLRKIKNMVTMLKKGGVRELIERYEEEIDRAKMLIEKSIINHLTFSTLQIKSIEMYYIATLSQALERMVDHIIELKKVDEKLCDIIGLHVDMIKEIIEFKPDIQKVIEFAKSAESIKNYETTNIENYNKKRIREYFITISEVLMDWAVTSEI